MTKQQPKFSPAEAPAVIEADHVQDRETSKVAGAPKAWRRRSPLQAIYEKGQLAGGNPKYLSMDRFEAGVRYSQLFMASQTAGTDSTQALNISRSHGGAGIGMAQATAIRDLVAIESHMGERDRLIVRQVCGLGFWPSEAVRAVCGDYKDTIPARMRESLDSLIEAMETARRNPNTVNIGREP